MRIGWALLALSACGGPMARSPGDAGSVASPDASVVPPEDGGVPQADAGVVSRGPTLAGCPVFPPDNAWNRDVSSETVDSHSDEYLAFMGASSLFMTHDFGGLYSHAFIVGTTVS